MSFQLVFPRKASLVCTSWQVTFKHFLMFLHMRSTMRMLAEKDKAVKNITYLKVEFRSKITSWPSELTPPFVHAVPWVHIHWPLPRVPSIFHNSSLEAYDRLVDYNHWYICQCRRHRNKRLDKISNGGDARLTIEPGPGLKSFQSCCTSKFLKGKTGLSLHSRLALSVAFWKWAANDLYEK